jgi:hypothetical protein
MKCINKITALSIMMLVIIFAVLRPVYAVGNKPDDSASIGFEAGRVYFSRHDGRVYRDTPYISPYIFGRISNFFGVSLNMEYFRTDTVEEPSKRYSTFSMRASTLNLHLFIRLTGQMSLSVSSGLGGAVTEVYFPSSGLKETSEDPYMALGGGLNIFASNLRITLGVSYKRVFYYYYAEKRYLHNDMDFGTVFAGIGNNL